MRAASDLGHDVMILALDRLLDKHGVIWLQCLDEDFRQRGADGAVEVDGDVDVVTGGLAQLGEFFSCIMNFGRSFYIAGGPVLGRPGLESREAPRRQLLDVRRCAGVGIDADFAPRRSPQQLIDRDAQGFALDIP